MKLVVMLVALFLLVGAARADDLYEGRTVVTGMMAENRPPAFAACLRDVLVKVSGDPRLLDDPAALALGGHAGDLVADYEYVDRMSGIQIHDEQGSRDRSFVLTMTFDKTKIVTALHTLGRAPWTGPRPRVAVILRVRNGERTYVLASDGAQGRDQRESLDAVSWQSGVPVAIPKGDTLRAAGVGFESTPSQETLDALAAAAGGDVALAGSLIWNPGTLGWASDWQLRWKGATHRWQIRDVNFDDAFRSGLRGSAQILSGQGTPK
ncbi:DUF2066 domain-containing protein [soil metagenome]